MGTLPRTLVVAPRDDQLSLRPVWLPAGVTSDVLMARTVIADVDVSGSLLEPARVGLFDVIIAWNCLIDWSWIADRCARPLATCLSISGSRHLAAPYVHAPVAVDRYGRANPGAARLFPVPTGIGLPRAAPTAAQPAARAPVQSGDKTARTLGLLPLVEAALKRRSVTDPRAAPFVLAIIENESAGYRSTIDSSAGAIGVMQVMPGTGKHYGYTVDELRDPAKNIDAGVRYLMLACLPEASKIAQGDAVYGVAAAMYNAGVARIKSPKAWPPETRAYVPAVMASFYAYTKILRKP